jgi:hypothetical protein
MEVKIFLILEKRRMRMGQVQLRDHNVVGDGLRIEASIVLLGGGHGMIND